MIVVGVFENEYIPPDLKHDAKAITTNIKQ